MLNANASGGVRAPKSRLLTVFGPGLITGASDDDPSGIATYSQAGGQLGYGLAWTMLFSYPLMSVVQEISARIGRTTGRGIAGNMRVYYPDWLLQAIVCLLLIANTINIGADLGAMADALRLIVGGPQLLYVALFAGISVVLEIFLKYSSYVSILKWLTVSLFAYFGTILFVHVPWGEVARGLFVPTLSPDPQFWTTVVAIFGTTISPYLFFWQASQEVEEEKASRRKPLKKAPRRLTHAIKRIRLDTYVGMAFSNLVALAIIITAGATLHVRGITDITSSSQAAEALKPVAGQFASMIFALGIIGTGLLAIPVLAGSAGYALGEARKWPIGLERKPLQAKAFYAAIALATLLGACLDFTPVNPIKALYWSAVVNGVVAVPVMVVMMLMTARRDVMGNAVVPLAMRLVGWAATGIMALAAAVMIFQLFY
ncbi:Nramp family divalent metal transporter [Mesorhizobium sp. M0051]|uniref:Nramp family divalent metal transporter n=1 Tax=unclassified Mesorhizobium TaxID=325217 RepID=UPI0003CE346F|nr:Nramp family divalent metal transporter [Mesorhizobium sp. LNHC252B00]ESY74895.1 iron transporter [Mesorhizobium sp. LNHC252B00]